MVQVCCWTEVIPTHREASSSEASRPSAEKLALCANVVASLWPLFFGCLLPGFSHEARQKTKKSGFTFYFSNGFACNYLISGLTFG